MNVTRISSGWTSSVFGSQFAALSSHGIGSTPSIVRPSFQRPRGWPPVAICVGRSAGVTDFGQIIAATRSPSLEKAGAPAAPPPK